MGRLRNLRMRVFTLFVKLPTLLDCAELPKSYTVLHNGNNLMNKKFTTNHNLSTVKPCDSSV